MVNYLTSSLRPLKFTGKKWSRPQGTDQLTMQRIQYVIKGRISVSQKAQRVLYSAQYRNKKAGTGNRQRRILFVK